jgi:hypothetical protein
MGRKITVGCGLAALHLLLAAACATHPAAPLAPPLPQRAFIDAPAERSPLHIAISPDGAQVLAWMFDEDRSLALWSRWLGSDASGALPGSARPEGTASGFPFWSPDSSRIGVFGNLGLQVIDRRGGTLRTIAPANFGQGGSWNRDDVILFAPRQNGPLYRVAASGGPPVQATTLDVAHGETAHRHPCFLPDGRHFLFLAINRSEERTGIWVGSLDSSERRFLVRTPVKALFAQPATLLYAQGNTLLAQPFDADAMALAGEPVPLVDDLDINPGYGAAGLAVSDSGVLVYRPRVPRTSRKAVGVLAVVRDWPALRSLAEPLSAGDAGAAPARELREIRPAR